jgi:integrase
MDNSQNNKSVKPLDNNNAEGGWMGELKSILDKNKGIRVNGKTASFRTQDIVHATLFTEFENLRNLGYRVMPRNLGNKHMQVLVKNWYYDRKLKTKTMVTHLTQFRKFATWIGKDGMISSLASYLPEVDPKSLEVHYAAEKTKSWSGNGLDVEEMIARADAINIRFGCMLRLQWAFGFRASETLKCDPWATDNITSIAIVPSQGKGNRSRNIPMDSVAQRNIIEYIKRFVRKGERVGWCEPNGEALDLKQNTRKYFTNMEKMGLTKKELGVTGHGLRSEYLEDLALRLGYIPATLGGTIEQMPKEDREIIEYKVSEAAGHGRRSATAAYCGGVTQLRANSKKLRDAAAQKAVDSNPAHSNSHTDNNEGAAQ